MLEKTDKQAGAILEAIRDVTPEVAEQAVAYYRAVEIGWLVGLGSLVLIALIVGVRSYLHVRRDGWEDNRHTMTNHGYCAIISGIVAGILLLICVTIASDLACIVYAPDYYAADCVVELGRKAVGN